jgi:dihydrofolate reductase
MPTRKLVATLQMTLDGLAEWPVYPGEDEQDDSDFWNAMYTSYWSSVDSLLLGRISYEKWASFWPKVEDQRDAPEFHRQFSKFANRAEKIVFSRTLKTASWEKSRIIREDAHSEIKRLKSLGGGTMLVGGGPRLVQGLLDLGLVDELRVTLFPSLTGRGKPWFNVKAIPDNPDDRVPIGAPLRHDFRLIEARPLRSGGGSVFLHYASASG